MLSQIIINFRTHIARFIVFKLSKTLSSPSRQLKQSSYLPLRSQKAIFTVPPGGRYEQMLQTHTGKSRLNQPLVSSMSSNVSQLPLHVAGFYSKNPSIVVTLQHSARLRTLSICWNISSLGNQQLFSLKEQEKKQKRTI